MKKDEILVIETDMFMSESDICNLWNDLLRQRESGIIILPSGCRAVIAPKNIKGIEVRKKNGTV